MQTTRYKFQKAVESAKADSTQWLKDEFKSVLESDKDFTRKCDYIGFSIAGIDSKVAAIDEEIKELQQIRQKLKAAKEIALTSGAEVFSSYGIEKIEGAGISSITVTKPTKKRKEKFEVLDPDILIAAGYTKTVLDEDAVRKAYDDGDENVQQYCELSVIETTTPAKLKINKRRSANNIDSITEEIAS